MSERLFHYIEGNSKKFWSISLEDTSHTIHFGRIGTEGQEKTKAFSSEKEARASYEKLIKEKLGKGYTEVTDADSDEDEADEVIKKLRKKLAKFKKPAWYPIVKDCDGSLRESKFSGTPWLGKNEEWPICPNCKNTLQLFLQLDLGNLPAELEGEFGKGILQLFYCTNSEPLCEVECEAYFPFAESVRVRIVETDGDGKKVEIPLAEYFPAKLITGWEKHEDLPSPDEFMELLGKEGLSLEEDEEEMLYEECGNELDLSLPGDKLGGWPAWVQGVEYPSCPVCSQRMRLVFQLDSECNLPCMFGDAGCGHITQCKDHKDQLAFGWACG